MIEITEIRRANLAALVKRDGLSSIAKRMKKPDSQINDMVAGRKSFGEKVARAIEQAFDPNLPAGWLDTPVNLSEIQNLPVREKKASVFGNLNVVKLCGESACHQPLEVVSSLTMPLREAIRLIGDSNKSGKICMVSACHDSMSPTIQPDDLLFIDTSVTQYAGEAVYTICHGDELLCKRISLVGKDIIVSSDNKFYPSWDWAARPTSSLIVGKVIRSLPMQFTKFSV